MHDRNLVRTSPDLIRQGLARKGMEGPVDEVLRLDEERRTLLTRLEAQLAEQNRLSKTIGKLMAAGDQEGAEDAKTQTAQLKAEVAQGEGRRRELDARLHEAELRIPNIPQADVPDGCDETANVVVREWGDKPVFSEQPRPHWEVAESLGLLDVVRGAKIAGSGWMLYTGAGARLQRALFTFMVEHQTSKNGYREVYPPYAVNRAAMIGTGQLPKFEDDMFRVDGEDLFLIPTAEAPVTNIYADEMLDGSMLTIKMAAYSACFRREAGAAGKDTRGLLRMHQFDKVELVKLTKPEDSDRELESLLADAESVLQTLGLHYRVVELCAGELSFSNAKCYDIELWAPGVQKYLEISSCSNFESFQARRANIRFRRAQGDKPEFVHTLNGSGLACPRLFAAIVETFQEPDGSVALPEAIRPYFGSDRIA